MCPSIFLSITIISSLKHSYIYDVDVGIKVYRFNDFTSNLLLEILQAGFKPVFESF